MACINRLRAIRRAFWSQRRFPGVRAGNERGIALILSLVMLVLMAILGAWALNTSSTDLRIAGNTSNAENAFYCGDAGIAFATNPNILTTAFDAAGGGTVAQPFGIIAVGSCNFQGSITFLASTQLANVSGKPYDQDATVNSSNDTTQRFHGLYFVVDANGNAAGNSFVPIQAGVQQVVGN